MSQFSQYRKPRKQSSDSDSDCDIRIRVPATRLLPAVPPPLGKMDPDQLREIIRSAVSNALAEQAATNEQRERALTQRINELAQ